eukprot:2911140-Pyramimonas_sp.AAC.1
MAPPRPIRYTPSHGSWPQRMLHRRLQWDSGRVYIAPPRPIWHTPPTGRGPTGSSAEGSSGR